MDEETGTHLRRAVEQMQQRLSDISPRIYMLQQAPTFGNDKYARQAAAHFLFAMDSDSRSLVKVYFAALDLLRTLHQAIDVAISKYDASDEAARETLSTFRNLDRQ
ncbi:hypothetical protein [Amycolatopsis thermophila]|uniref:Uncharacterized protein n=1 Tax=Amycolatopsis thermophila TaxID=206084 RepID=A0ABU0ES19_9PSEU|nr:hypothetical protein [Amycolatopsis thermophila]MDQ0378080.1 hypothetical protein [Amycolatopsis thermophila]